MATLTKSAEQTARHFKVVTAVTYVHPALGEGYTVCLGCNEIVTNVTLKVRLQMLQKEIYLCNRQKGLRSLDHKGHISHRLILLESL